MTNGNAPNDTPCNDGSGLLCSDPGVHSTTLGGGTIPAFLGPNPFSYSELDNQTTNTNGYGASIQATDTQTVFGFNNHLVAGVSFDGAQTEFTGVSYIGGITPDHPRVRRPRRGHRRARQQRAGSGGDQRCVLRRVLRRHAQPDRPAGADRLGPVQRRRRST